MNKIVVSIVLAVLSLMVTIVSFIINDIAAYRQWTWDNRGQISEHLENKGKTPPPGGNRSLPPGKTEHHLQTGAPKNRAAKSTFPWKDKIGSSARISGISGNVWPGLILYI